MDGGLWDPRFLTVGVGSKGGNQREEARMIDVVMDYRWRYQYELWLAYYRYRWIDIDI